MKKFFAFIMLGVFAMSPLFLSASNFDQDKKAAAEYLQMKMKEKIQSGAEKALAKMDPAGAKALKDIANKLEKAELAASLCWDIIEFGMETTTDQRVFAANFARRFEKYISKEYKIAANAANAVLSWGGGHIPDENDLRTALFELGKSTFNAIQNMSSDERQKSKQAGVSINEFGRLMLDIGGSTGRQWKKQFEK